MPGTSTGFPWPNKLPGMRYGAGMTAEPPLFFEMPKPRGPLDRLIRWSTDRSMAQERSSIHEPALWVKVNRYLMWRFLSIFVLVIALVTGAASLKWWGWVAAIGLVFFASQGVQRWVGGGRAYASGYMDGRHELLNSLSKSMEREKDNGLYIDTWIERQRMDDVRIFTRVYVGEAEGLDQG